MSITHVTSFYDSPDSIRRNKFARSTWKDTYRRGDWRPLPILDGSLSRLFKEGKRYLPYIKDLIDEACKLKTDYICITNADTCFAPSFNQRIKGYELFFSHRKDFSGLTGKLSQDEVDNCHDRYIGLDLFLFPSKWWSLTRSRCPDMLLGREAWDLIMVKLIEASGGVCVENLIYHERHENVWERPGNRTSLPGQLHNRKLAKKFCDERGLDSSDFGFTYWAPQRPATSETPAGGWKCTWCGVSRTSYSLELLVNQMTKALAVDDLEAPKNLKDIIIAQSLPEETWR